MFEPKRLLSTKRIVGLVACLVLMGCGDHEGPTEDSASVDDNFCHGQADGVSCNDGNSCTVDDRCGAGVCLGKPQVDLAVCDDANPCTSNDYCSAGQCTGILPDCSALDGNCVVGACDPHTVECVAVTAEVGATCDDADVCTATDVCGDSGCVGAVLDCSSLDGEC
jgi:hypothetical protein